MTGRLTKARITKDVRYQESREVTLEWWDYNLHSRVTSFFLGGERFNSRKTKVTLKEQYKFNFYFCSAFLLDFLQKLWYDKC